MYYYLIFCFKYLNINIIFPSNFGIPKIISNFNLNKYKIPVIYFSRVFLVKTIIYLKYKCKMIVI